MSLRLLRRLPLVARLWPTDHTGFAVVVEDEKHMVSPQLEPAGHDGHLPSTGELLIIQSFNGGTKQLTDPHHPPPKAGAGEQPAKRFR